MPFFSDIGLAIPYGKMGATRIAVRGRIARADKREAIRDLLSMYLSEVAVYDCI